MVQYQWTASPPLWSEKILFASNSSKPGLPSPSNNDRSGCAINRSSSFSNAGVTVLTGSELTSPTSKHLLTKLVNKLTILTSLYVR